MTAPMELGEDKSCVMLVDDDDVLRESLMRAFTRRGYEVHGASNSEEAMVLARREAPDMAVVDLKMPGASGLELLRDILAMDPTIRVVLLTGYGSIATAIEAMRLGATYYVPKPADVDDILAAFERGESPPLTITEDYKAPSLARAEWEHINRVPVRLWQQHLRGRQAARHPPALAPAQAQQIPTQRLMA